MEAAESSAKPSEGVRAATRVVIVGGSEHAASLARLLARTPSVEISAVCAAPSDPAGRFAQEAGVRLCSDPLRPLSDGTPPDIVIDLSEDVVTRAALESVMPPGTELLGGSAADLVQNVLNDDADPPPTPPRDPAGDHSLEAAGRARRLEASNEALIRANRDLEARLAEVYFMHEFVKALVAYRRVDDVSSVVVDACAGILGADAAAVYLLDRERWVLCLARSQGRPPGAVAGEMALTDPLLGAAFKDDVAYEEDSGRGAEPGRWLVGQSARASTQVAVALKAGGEPIGVLVLGWTATCTLGTPELERLRALADQSALSLQNALLHAELEQLSVTDRLTELFNHGYLTKRLEQELGRAERFGHPLSVIMLDVDDFKVFNDRYGHLVGDDVLRAVSSLIRENLREMDVAARYGGEEFVVLVPETGSEGARAVAERIRQGVATHVFLRDDAGVDVHTTVSIGVATFPACGRTVESLLSAADGAMYVAKRAGKDRVIVSAWSGRSDPPRGPERPQ